LLCGKSFAAPVEAGQDRPSRHVRVMSVVPLLASNVATGRWSAGNEQAVMSAISSTSTNQDHAPNYVPCHELL
jgi:hypothetical protein